ncbi:MAG: hypothetical protein ACK4VV_01385 [Pseudomonas sp.]
MPSKDADNAMRWLPALLAFALWGGWALYANLGASTSQAIIAGILQGTASAVITLCMALAINRLFPLFRQPLIALLLPPCIIVSITSSLLFILHSLGQTPQLWLTILPPSAVAFAFCLFLTARLTLQNRSTTPES